MDTRNQDIEDQCVNCPYSLVEVADFLEANFSGGQHSATWSGTPMRAVCSPSALQIGFSTMHPSIVAMSETLFGTDMLTATKEWLMLYRRVFRAKNFPSQTTCTQAKALPERELKINGPLPSKSFDVRSLGMCSWKTWSDSLGVTDTSVESFQTWPRKGMMCDGKLYLGSKSERPTLEGEFGSPECGDGNE